MKDPQEDPLAVHCFCVCSGSALLGDLLGVSRFRDRDLRSDLSIYPWIFLHVLIVYRFLVRFFCVVVFYHMIMCVSCFGLVVLTFIHTKQNTRCELRQICQHFLLLGQSGSLRSVTDLCAFFSNIFGLYLQVTLPVFVVQWYFSCVCH